MMKTPTQPEPLPDSARSKDLRDRSYALVVDGRRVNAELHLEVAEDGITIVAHFRTSIGALDDPSIDPIEETAWAGWKVGDSCHLRQPSKVRYPSNGFVTILRMEMPKNAHEETMFVCKSITPIYDHVNEIEICGASEYCKIPATWFQR
jgi:hypothetical protein